MTNTQDTDLRRIEIDARLAPYLDKIDRLRQKKSDEKDNRIKLALLLGGIIIFTIIGTIVSQSETAFYALIIGSLLLVFLLAWAILLPKKQYDHYFKTTVFPIVLDAIKLNFTYQPKMKLPIDIFENAGLMGHHCGFAKQEDHLIGTYKGVDVTFCDSHIKILEIGHKYPSTLFAGSILFLTFPVPFNAHTIVLNDQRRRGNFLDSFSPKSPINEKQLEAVHLEDPEFEDKFKARSTDQHEARYILSPTMIEQFKNKRIEASFFDNKAILLIPSYSELMEVPSLYKPIKQANFVAEWLLDLDGIYRVIDELNLCYFSSRRKSAVKQETRLQKR